MSLQDVLDVCLKSDSEEGDLEIDSNDSLNEDSSEVINLPQLIKNFDEEQICHHTATIFFGFF